MCRKLFALQNTSELFSMNVLRTRDLETFLLTVVSLTAFVPHPFQI